jgi:hypothetical protein
VKRSNPEGIIACDDETGAIVFDRKPTQALDIPPVTAIFPNSRRGTSRAHIVVE